MDKKELKQTFEEIKELEKLYQETLDMVKTDKAMFLELKEALAQTKTLFQKCYTKYQETAAVSLTEKGDYTDEELYAFWTSYRTSFTEWQNVWVPKVNAFLDEKKPVPIVFLEELLVFLNKIKKEAETFIEQYGLLEKTLSPAMSPKFSTWKDETLAKLNDKDVGWIAYIDAYNKVKTETIKTNALIEEINAKITLHKELQIIWREESSPNYGALLVTDENVKNTQDLYDNVQVLKKLIETAPEELKKVYEEWYQITLKEEWEAHLKLIKKGLVKTKENKDDSKLINGNPELIKGEDQRYIDPNKKIGLYKKAKNDTHQIDANDVKQGKFEDCFVLSPIAALANTDPTIIEKMIVEKEDGSFEVTLYLRKDSASKERTAEKINVKREFVIDKNGNDVFAGKGDKELWVQVLEKAVAIVRGGYDGIDGGSSDEILELLTNKKVNRADFKANDLNLLWEDLLKAYKNKKATNFSSLPKPEKVTEKTYTTTDDQLIYYNHNYYLDKIDADKIWLNNPQGMNHLVLKKAELENYFIRYYILE